MRSERRPLIHSAESPCTSDHALTATTSGERLTQEERTRPIPVTMWHEGQVLRDSPTPLGDLIVGHGEVHLAMHSGQLQALRAA